MFKKIVFNLIVFVVIAMIGFAVLKANKPPKSNVLKANLNSIREQKSGLVPKEAKYYRVIEE